MWFLYDLAVLAVLLLAGPILLLNRGTHYLPTLRGRLGGPAERPRRSPGGHGSARRSSKKAHGALWIHAVSVGEVAVAATLIRALPEDVPVLVTTITPTGQERARQTLRGRATVAYLPFDFGFAVERFLRRHEPAALVLVEGDYWPRLLAAVRRRGLPVMVVNGRVGDRSFRRLRRLRRFIAPLFSPVERFGVQSDDDRERLEELGVAADRLRVTGNLKYDSPEPERHPALEEQLLELAGGRPLLVVGSTMAAHGEVEEETVLDAFGPLRERTLLVLAPRHPERWPEVAELVEARGWKLRRRSRLDAAEDAADPPEVVLLDSLGELAGLYAIAFAAFIGGTLVRTGGHNPLEAARFGIPVAVGPSMENFREMAETFDRRDAWGRVGTAAGLERLWRRWLDDPESAWAVGERGRRLVEDNRGALDGTLEMLQPLVDSVTRSSPP